MLGFIQSWAPDALSRTIASFSFFTHFNAITRPFFEKTSDLETPEMGRAMKALLKNESDAAAAAIVSKDVRYNSMLRTTCVATMLTGGHATNALPQTAAPLIGATLLGFHSATNQNYDLLLYTAGAAALIGALIVLPIKKVK